MAKKIPVVECFGPTLQGEGALAGSSSHFLRTGGCPRRCVQCDSLHAVLPENFRETADYLEPEGIANRILDLDAAEYVTFSGGDPLMWKGLGEVIELVKSENPAQKFAVETQGDLFQKWLQDIDHITVSPKAPGMDPDLPVNFSILEQYVEKYADKMCFKVVIFSREDFELVKELLIEFPHIPMYLSVGTYIREFEDGSIATQQDLKERIYQGARDVFDWAHEEGLLNGVRILPQIHVLVWGERLGV